MGGGVEEALRRLEFLGGDDQPDTPLVVITLGDEKPDTRPFFLHKVMIS